MSSSSVSSSTTTTTQVTRTQLKPADSRQTCHSAALRPQHGFSQLDLSRGGDGGRRINYGLVTVLLSSVIQSVGLRKPKQQKNTRNPKLHRLKNPISYSRGHYSAYKSKFIHADTDFSQLRTKWSINTGSRETNLWSNCTHEFISPLVWAFSCILPVPITVLLYCKTRHFIKNYYGICAF